MWLKTIKNELVNMDRVAGVEIDHYPYAKFAYSVEAVVQFTSNEDLLLSFELFESVERHPAENFTRWLYDQLTTGCRVADVAEYLAAFVADDEEQ